MKYLNNEQQPASIAKVTMSDKTLAYNVIANLDGQEFTFACTSAGHARTLADAINQTGWIERS